MSRQFSVSVSWQLTTSKREEDFTLSERNLRKTRVGMVVSDKMDKTIVVAIKDNVRHVQSSLRRMTRTTPAESATRLRLWRPDPFPRIRDGV